MCVSPIYTSFNSARWKEKKNFGVTQLTEIKLPLETQIKGLLSNINSKIHFFNYSADVNPFLHCGTGIIDANLKWEQIKKK